MTYADILSLIEKKRTQVRFIDTEGRHEYRLGFDELTGVTTILKEVIYYNKYKCPDYMSPERWESILNKAQERGSEIHEMIQAWETAKEHTPKPEYAEVCEQALNSYQISKRSGKYTGLMCADYEYLISNNVDVASKIDLVMWDEASQSVVLADIKTTSELDTEYLSWQLSIYAYLFERQVGLFVGDLLGIWVRDGKCEFVRIERKADSEVEALIEDWRNGIQRTEISVAQVESECPAVLSDGARMYAELDAELKRLKELQDSFKALAIDFMRENNEKSRKIAGITITYTPATQRTGFDEDKFKADNPELYAKYYNKVSNVKEQVRITIKK